MPFGSEYVSCEGTVNALGALPGGGACFGAVEVAEAVGAASCASSGIAWKGSSIIAPIAAEAIALRLMGYLEWSLFPAPPPPQPLPQQPSARPRAPCDSPAASIQPPFSAAA